MSQVGLQQGWYVIHVRRDVDVRGEIPGTSHQTSFFLRIGNYYNGRLLDETDVDYEILWSHDYVSWIPKDAIDLLGEPLDRPDDARLARYQNNGDMEDDDRT